MRTTLVIAEHPAEVRRRAFSIAQTALILGVSPVSVRRLISRGLLRPNRTLRWLWLENAFWMAMAHSTASLTEAKEAMIPSPSVFDFTATVIPKRIARQRIVDMKQMQSLGVPKRRGHQG
jgi:hypothetical protein